MSQVQENVEPHENVHTSLLMTETVPESMVSPAHVVVDAEGNGSISVEVPSIDYNEVKKRTKATVDPDKVDIARPIRVLKTPREIKLKISIVLLFCVIVASTTCILVLYVEDPLHYKVGNAVLYTGSREFNVHLNGENRVQGLIGRNLPDMLPSSCDPFDSSNLCLEYANIARLLIHWEQIFGMECYSLTWESYTPDLVHRDCYSLENSHWYGGSVSANQQWPLEKMNLSRAPFVSGDESSSFGPVIERFWLSSQGVGIWVTDDSPLFISINEDTQKLCFEGIYRNLPFPNSEGRLPKLEYTLCAGADIPTVQQKMMAKFGKKLRALPHETLIQGPMWAMPSICRQNKLNEAAILNFVGAIRANNLPGNSLEIECDYAATEGNLVIDPDRFPNITSSIERIQESGFYVVVRVTPFMNTDSKAFDEGLRNQYLVEDPRSQVPGLTKWKGGVAGLLDTTSRNATAWFVNRLESLQTTVGINYFTFDYGQVSYLPVEFKTEEVLKNPCTFTQRYMELADKTKDPVVTRSAYKSQDIPLIILTIPKAPVWGYDNGLKSLIPTALTLGIIGYPFVMPDLDVNTQNSDASCTDTCRIDKEFLLRWLGLTAFFPTMRINVPIWDYDPETIRIAKQFITFHRDVIAPLVLGTAPDDGNATTPVLRPLWWIAPSDREAQSIDSEFLIGNDTLVAPVLDPGLTKRQVYLPEGKWVDQLHEVTLNGGAWVEVDAQLDQVPYFVRTQG